MSILVYKQRFRHPNKKDTPGANYAHIRYIATRPRVLKNEKMNHGLFGKLEPGVVTEFEDWKDVAKLSYANSKKGIVMYRSVVSFAEEMCIRDRRYPSLITSRSRPLMLTSGRYWNLSLIHIFRYP